MSIACQTSSTDAPPDHHVPGEPGVWVLIGLELAIFSVLFAAYVVTWADHPRAFEGGATLTHRDLGALNTAILLTSSLSAAIASAEVVAGRFHAARRAVIVTAGLGLAFIVVKAAEYTDLIGDDLTPRTDEFWMYYYVLTGLHLLHVVVGLGALAFAARWLRRDPTPAAPADVRSTLSYWHMVDLLWILIFSFVYIGSHA